MAVTILKEGQIAIELGNVYELLLNSIKFSKRGPDIVLQIDIASECVIDHSQPIQEFVPGGNNEISINTCAIFELDKELKDMGKLKLRVTPGPSGKVLLAAQRMTLLGVKGDHSSTFAV